MVLPDMTNARSPEGVHIPVPDVSLTEGLTYCPYTWRGWEKGDNRYGTTSQSMSFIKLF
jgi:hypothetical protein